MEKMSDNERIEEGQILGRAIVEMMGAPKEHLEKTIRDYAENMKGDLGMELINVDYSDPQLQENGKLYVMFADMEIWFKDVEKVVEFCFDSLPSSIEILKPSEIRFRTNTLSGLLNDLQARLHKVDMALKTFKSDQEAAAITFKTLVDNFMSHAIKSGKKTAEEIAEAMGIEKDKAEKWLDGLAEKKIINKKDNIYSI
jgi:hypothetical protein